MLGVQKIPPSAIELERAILGAILLEADAIDRVISILKPIDFYDDAHTRIYEAAIQMKAKNTPIDLLSMIEHLRKHDQLDIVGGPYKITQLTINVTSTAHLEHHCFIVLEKSMLRLLAVSSLKINNGAYDAGADALELLETMQSDVFNIVNRIADNTIISIEDSAIEVIRSAAAARANKGALTGVPSGFAAIDRVTNGWQKTDLIIVAARPAVGKTAFALNVAKNAIAFKQNAHSVLIFSLEMSHGQLTQRILSTVTQIPLYRIQRGDLSDAEMQLLQTKFASAFSGGKIFIDDRAGITIFELQAKAKMMVRKQDVGLIIVDYLQLVDAGLGGKIPREQQISHISRALKKLAKEAAVPVIALSQLHRGIDDRTDNEPRLSDLRESGAIEQDADIVLFLYRPNKQDIKNDPSLECVGFVKIAKHRSGQLYEDIFTFHGETQTWTEREQPFQLYKT